MKKRPVFVFLLILSLALSIFSSCAAREDDVESESLTDGQRGDIDTTSVSDYTSSEKQTIEDVTTTSAPQKNGYTVCIDAGHQQKGITEKEPNGPGSSVMKAKLSSGTSGVVTKIPEYVLTLEVSLMLKEELIARGYEVVMIRETNDCPKSNAERAIIANESGSDIFVRIHANGSSDPTVNGALTCAPSTANEFLSKPLVVECSKLSKSIVDSLCRATGAKNRGIYSTDTMTGINWCSIPVTIVEMGYMSNPEEDRRMATEEYRKLIAEGIADGIDGYFN